MSKSFHKGHGISAWCFAFHTSPTLFMLRGAQVWVVILLRYDLTHLYHVHAELTLGSLGFLMVDDWYFVSHCNNGLRYAKRSLMSWVVIPKGRARVAAPALLLVWHRLLKKKKINSKKIENIFFLNLKCRWHTKRRVARPLPSVLLLVWQRLRP